MANNKWRGDAPAVQQVNTVTPASPTVGNIFRITINGKTAEFVATDTLVATVTAGLVAAISSLSATALEFSKINAIDNGTDITIAANVAGEPFIQTSSSATGSGSAGHSCVTTTDVDNTGPNNWDEPLNWSLGAIPVSTDDVYITDSGVDILWGIDQSAVVLHSLNIDASYTGSIGLPNYDTSGFYEYRDKFLALRATTVNIGSGSGSGSGRIKLDLGTGTSSAINVYSTGRTIDNTLPAFVLKGSAQAYTINIVKGDLGLAVEEADGDVVTVSTLNVGSVDSSASDVTITAGAGAAITTISQSGGDINVRSSVTTWVMYDGTATVGLAANITTLKVYEGLMKYAAAGTITTATIGSGGTLDCSKDRRSKTITNVVQMYKDAAFIDPDGTTAVAAGFKANGCRPSQLILDVKYDANVTFA